MPGKVRVKIISGKNLPVMDRSSDTTDAFVEIKLGNTSYKTDVCRKSLHPQWNSDWFKFELDDSELQDEPLQIRLMDYDTYSANDAIGKVYLNLNPLLSLTATPNYTMDPNAKAEGIGSNLLSGWIPVYDTMHGIRGEVNIIVKVELFSDYNKFRQSSCGVQFFCSPTVPQGYYAQLVHGFVEELIVNDDPEYQWIDKIRTPRASNEARQTLFFKLSGELQRKIGVKALGLGGNAVIGYSQRFDLEGESGIVARGIGTAVTLVKPLDSIGTFPAEERIEERALSYLKFVGGDKSFRLTAEPVKCSVLIPFPSPILPLSLETTRNRSLKDRKGKHLKVKGQPILLRSTKSNPSLTEPLHSSSVRTLLKQEDLRGTPSSGLAQRLKNLKYSSQSSLSKKMIALKAKLGDAGIGEEADEETEAEKKRGMFKRTTSESSAMAELLARSVIQAHNSLSCILEVQGSPAENTDTMQKLEPLANLLSHSEPNLSSEECSEIEGSEAQSCSSSDSSSSLYDYDYSLDCSKDSNIDFDTISNILNNVHLLQQNQIREKLQKQYSLPALPTDPSLESVEYSLADKRGLFKHTSDIEMDNVSFSGISNHSEQVEQALIKSVAEAQLKQEPQIQLKPKAQLLEEEPQTHFESEAEHKIEEEEVEAKAETEPTNEKRAEFILCPNDEELEIESQPQSPPIRKETNKNSFSNSSIIIPPVMIGADIKPKGLVKTAMQTMLLEKVNIMGTYTPPTSPTIKFDEEEVASKTAPKLNNKPTGGMFYSPFNHDFSVQPNSKIPRSSTSASFSDYIRKNDTVLGVPFTAISNLKSGLLKRQQSHPCLLSQIDENTKYDPKQSDDLIRDRQNCLSDSQLHKSDDLKTKLNLPVSLKHKFHLLSFLTRSHESSLHNEHDVKHKRKFSLLSHKNKPKTSDDVKKRFTFMSRSRKASENDQKNDKECQTDDVLIVPIQDPKLMTNNINDSDTQIDPFNKESCLTSNRQNASPLPEQLRLSPEQKTAPSPVRMHRRSSDSDLSITPKGNSLTGSDRSGGGNFSKSNMIRSQLRQENFDMLEYPFLTMNKFPLGLIVHLGGVVSARSVKLLERITNVEEPESRDIWWTEIRMEIRSHARSLNCNAVLGYTESTSICDDICILSASGTAAVVGFSYPEEMEDNLMGLKIGKDSSSTHNLDKDKDKNSGKCPDSPEHFTVGTNCSITHLPYGEGSAPKRGHIMRCSSCCKGLVPEILIATIEPPENIPYTGRGCFIESFVCRPLKDLKGESTAKEISDGLPFLEYELHRHLVNKLKIKGMNAIFGLKVRISVGEKMLIGIAIGTALFLSSLPNPVVPQVRSDRLSDRKLLNLQKNLADAVRKNRTIYQLKEVQESENGVTGESSSDDEEIFQMDLSSGNKDCCILEVEDEQDEELLNFLIEQRPPDGFHVVSTETVPGLEDMEIVEDLQLFKQIYRAKLLPSYNLNYHFNRLLQSVYFKLRRMVPCALCDLQFRVDVPEGDEIQLCVLGTALGLKAQSKASRKHDEELIFKLEDYVGEEAEKNKSRSPSKSRSSVRKYVPEQERHGVDITPLTYVPGAKIERYLGYMNFFFIRETTSIREEGGLSGFIHSFVTEVLAIVRAHITALGGNAMVAYFLSECVLNHNLHKNQGQCLINVGGDIVFVSYFKEEL